MTLLQNPKAIQSVFWVTSCTVAEKQARKALGILSRLASSLRVSCLFSGPSRSLSFCVCMCTHTHTHIHTQTEDRLDFTAGGINGQIRPIGREGKGVFTLFFLLVASFSSLGFLQIDASALGKSHSIPCLTSLRGTLFIVYDMHSYP